MGNSKSFNIQTPKVTITDTANCRAISTIKFPGAMGTIYSSDPEYYQILSYKLDSNYGNLIMISFTIIVLSQYNLTIKLSNASHIEVCHQSFYMEPETTNKINYILTTPYAITDQFFIDFKADTDTAIKDITFYQK
ncbi:MAG: hypothetical protein ACOYLE_01585 [Bacteroidales bacterium]